MNKEITLFAVRNEKGEWYRRKGYGGYGKCWVEKFSQARVYNRIGPARALISWWSNNYKDYPTPQLVQFQVSSIKVLDETARVEKQKLNKQKAEQRKEIRDKQYRLERAQIDLENAQKTLKELS